ARSEIQLQEYILDTLTYIKTVRDFCDREQAWTRQRNSEIRRIRNIKRRAESTGQKLEKDLGVVLRDTLAGLEKLQHFVDALERLAVTSLFVFTDEVFLMKDVSSEAIQTVISTATSVSPLLLHFKRDAKAFFLPCLDNVEVLDYQLEKLHLTSTDPNMSDHLRQLTKIRMDESFRLTFLFNGKAQEFINVYEECRPRMFHFLTRLNETAKKLDKLKKGTRISNVAGSSVSVVGGALSIAGLALAPITAGVSLALTFTGVGLGVISGVGSIITHTNAMTKNKKHGKQASNIFESFKEDLDMVQNCLEEIGNSQWPVPHMHKGNTAIVALKVVVRTGAVAKGVHDMVQKGQALSALNGVRASKRFGCMALQKAGVAQNIPQIGPVVKASGQVISKVAVVSEFGVIAINALFIGLDLKIIYDECKNLHKGKKTKASQLIFSRATLWDSEVKAWDKIYQCLCEGKETFQRKLNVLERPFYC
ncbi:hypothetical protein NFI96_022870, partial [Prochilodus magdalenae]